MLRPRHRVVLAGAATLLASGCRIGFEPAYCQSGAVFCDDFERTTPIPLVSPFWMDVECAEPGASLVVDGSLDVQVPASSSNSFCSLKSRPVMMGSRFRMAFDFELDSPTFVGNIIAAELDLRLPGENADGIDQELVQLLVDANGEASIALVHHYPDISRSPTGHPFPGYNLADSAGVPWIDGRCRVVIDVDTLVPSSTATAYCGDEERPMTARRTAPAFGTTGSPIISLGVQAIDPPTAAWSLGFDNLELHAEPQ